VNAHVFSIDQLVFFFSLSPFDRALFAGSSLFNQCDDYYHQRYFFRVIVLQDFGRAIAGVEDRKRWTQIDGEEGKRGGPQGEWRIDWP